MTVEITVPRATVTVSPGVETRVRIQVSNNGDERTPVRIGVVRGRAAAWAQAEPAVVAAAPGESTSVDLVFRPPATVTPQATLQPFTVQAEDLRDGAVAARATGLLAVSAPDTLSARLDVRRTRRRTVTVAVTVENSGTSSVTLGVRPGLEMVGETPSRRKAPRRATARPSLLSIAVGGSGETLTTGRPKGAMLGARRPYVLTVHCVDVADETAAAVDDGDPPAPLATVTHAGIARARMSRPTATIVGLLLVGSLAAGGVWVARMGVLPERFTTAGGLIGNAPKDPVTAPYALVDVFALSSLGPAEATRDRLNAAGMNVRVVDSRKSGLIADGAEGFHVLIRDGFASPEAVKAYCDQYKVLAPNCQVVTS
ncbi:hypothetical protein GCM10009557_67590 [Virgisporangium ochraceum]